MHVVVPQTNVVAPNCGVNRRRLRVSTKTALPVQSLVETPVEDYGGVVNAALACRTCSWFGVYRSDVAHSLRGCPNCGAESLVVRDLEDSRWHDLGTALLGDLERTGPEQPPPAR
jgi:hypothetical protein